MKEEGDEILGGCKGFKHCLRNESALKLLGDMLGHMLSSGSSCVEKEIGDSAYSGFDQYSKVD